MNPTLTDVVGAIVSLIVAYVVILRNPQPVSLIIPILAVTSVLIHLLQNHVDQDASPALLRIVSFIAYITILSMRFSILETVGFTVATGLVTAILYAITTLALDRI